MPSRPLQDAIPVMATTALGDGHEDAAAIAEISNHQKA